MTRCNKLTVLDLRSMVLVLGLTLAGIGVSGIARAAESNVYAAVSSFSWKEFNDNGSRLLKESGALIGVGYGYRWESQTHVTLQPAAEIFGGKVDYDGSTQSGVALKSKVDYFGVKIKFETGWAIGLSETSQIEPFGGLGFSAWLRDIKDATAANGTRAYGYTEEWITLHVRLGLRGRADVSSRLRLFAETGLKLPVYNENTAYFSDAGLGSDVTLHPGKQTSLFGEAGLQAGRFRTSLFYDGMRFSRSSDVISGSFVYHQPRSTSDLYGLKIGAAF